MRHSCIICNRKRQQYYMEKVIDMLPKGQGNYWCCAYPHNYQCELKAGSVMAGFLRQQQEVSLFIYQVERIARKKLDLDGS